MEKVFMFLVFGFSLFLFILYMFAIAFKKNLDDTKKSREPEKESEDIEIHVGKYTYYVTIPKSIIIRKKKEC